ncbi:MAG: DUF1697 domain-containing protein [Syntrophomonadaceae bacterium]
MVYIALLRGINVGGKNVIKMADLKSTLEAMGLLDVRTYIQSGNVIFRSEEDEESLRKRMEDQIEKVFGFPVPVVLRNASEWEEIIRSFPFSDEEVAKAEALAKVESVYVALLLQAPSQAGMEQLDAYRSATDEYLITGRDVYLLLHHSIRLSKLAGNLHKLGVPSTVRNWKTIKKLAEMVQQA